jgi:chromate transporter
MKFIQKVDMLEDMAGPNRFALFLAFLSIGLSGFGGVLPWARRILVDTRGWLTAEAFNDTLALCQSLPGPNIVNLSVVVGGRFAGAAGALAAVTGLVGAPVVIVIALATLYERFGGIGRAPEAIAALGAAAAGLVAATAAKMARPLIARAPVSASAVMAASAIGVAGLKLPLSWVLLAMAPVGMILAWHNVRSGSRQRAVR